MLADFLLLDPRPVRDPAGTLVRRALRTAAVYLTHGMVRHGRVRAGPAAVEALSQVLRDLARGHPRAAGVLDAVEVERWGPPRGAAGAATGPGGGAVGPGGAAAAPAPRPRPAAAAAAAAVPLFAEEA